MGERGQTNQCENLCSIHLNSFGCFSFFANVLKPVGFIFNFALFFMFSFTSLSKVHLKVEYRDWHAAVLFGAISNMLASLKKSATDHFPTLFESRVQPLSALRSLHFTGSVKERKKKLSPRLVYIFILFTNVSVCSLENIDGTI